MAEVRVKVYGTDGPSEKADDYIGVAHARLGFPVSITIKRGNNCTLQHLSWAEATLLADALEEARNGVHS